jgi:hypothetical protein
MSARKQRKANDSSGSECSLGGRDVHERLVNQERSLQPKGISMVDDPDAVSNRLLSEVQCKAMCFEVTYKRSDGRVKPPYDGQIGLIRGARLTPSPADQRAPKRQRVEFSPDLPLSRFAATPTTALHNIINYPHLDETYSSSKVYCTNPSQTAENLEFPESGRVLTATDALVLVPADAESDQPALSWKSHDVSKGAVICDPNHFLTDKRLSFEKVPATFDVVPGVKVGVAIYRNFDIEDADAGATLSDLQLMTLFGSKGSVCVLTGEVTAVHDNNLTFEHSINTYRGCSGAIIFLLDRRQLEAAQNHAGEAVGVHVGGKPSYVGGNPANLGFRI